MDHQEFPWRRRRRRRSSLLEHIPEASEIDKSLSYLTRVKDRLISHSLFNLVPWDKLVNTLDHRGRSFLQLWEHRATARLYSSAARYRLHFHFRKLITIYQTQSFVLWSFVGSPPMHISIAKLFVEPENTQCLVLPKKCGLADLSWFFLLYFFLRLTV